MFVTLKDTVTNKIAKTTDDESVFWWTEGNGACDCNRILHFPEVDEAEYMKEQGLDDNYCLGHRRFIAVAVEGCMEGYTEDELITELNRNYPK